MKPKSLDDLEGLPIGGRRPASHLRFTVRSSKEASPSTLPPPPFENETDVAGLEWWLEAHMNLAGGQLCVEQVLEANDAFGRAVSASLETLRDALYEMYCDAADVRMSELAKPEGALGRYVRAVYALSEEVIAAMLETERDAPKIARLAAALMGLAAPDAERWLEKLGVDTQNPLEPLRRLSRDASALTSSVELLSRVLALKG